MGNQQQTLVRNSALIRKAQEGDQTGGVCVCVCVSSGGARRAGEGDEQLLSAGTDVAILGEQEQKRRKSFASKKKREK